MRTETPCAENSKETESGFDVAKRAERRRASVSAYFFFGSENFRSPQEKRPLAPALTARAIQKRQQKLFSARLHRFTPSAPFSRANLLALHSPIPKKYAPAGAYFCLVFNPRIRGSLCAVSLGRAGKFWKFRRRRAGRARAPRRSDIAAIPDTPTRKTSSLPAQRKPGRR